MNNLGINRASQKSKQSIWILLFIMIASYFSPSESAAVTQGLKIVFRLFALAWAAFIYYSSINKGMAASFKYRSSLALWFYVLYLILAIASFMWITEGPERSAKVFYSVLQWAMTFQSFIFVVYFYKVVVIHNYFYPSNKIEFIPLFAQVCSVSSVMMLIGAIALPDIFFRAMRGGEEIRLGGYLMNPNELGMLASMGASCALLNSFITKKQIPNTFNLLTNITVLALTTSRSSFIGFFIIAGLLLQRKASMKIKFIAYGLGAIAMPIVLQHVIFKDGNIDEVLSMTGRLPFWTALLNEGIVKEPFLGYGFQRIAYTNRFYSLHAYPGQMTHNTFMQVLMNLGFIGFGIVVLQMTFMVNGVIKYLSNVDKDFFLALIIPLLINSLTEFGIFGQTNYAIFFYQLLILFVVLEYNPNLSLKEQILADKFRRSI